MRLSIYVSFLLSWWLSLPSTVQAGEFDGVTQLAKRRVPWLANHLVFTKMESAGAARARQGAFELQSQNGKISIAATGPNAAAVGLNWYLKYYCHRSMSHMGDNIIAVGRIEIG